MKHHFAINHSFLTPPCNYLSIFIDTQTPSSETILWAIKFSIPIFVNLQVIINKFIRNPIDVVHFNSEHHHHPWENKIIFISTEYFIPLSTSAGKLLRRRCRQESSMGQPNVHIGKRCSLNSWILKYMEKLIKWELIRIGLISIVCKRKQNYVLGADHDV